MVSARGVSRSGGSVALALAAERPDVSAVVADCPFASGDAAINDGFRYVAHLPDFPLGPMARHLGRLVTGHDPGTLDATAALRALNGRPVLLIQTRAEDRFSNLEVDRLTTAAGLRAETWTVEDARHNQIWLQHREEYERRGGRFLAASAGGRLAAEESHPGLGSRVANGVKAGGGAVAAGSWWGVTANPLVSRVGDEIVRQGGTIVVSETTEIYGAEHLLTRRAVNAEVGQQLIAHVNWWEAYTRQIGTEIDNNPTPGNKAGGLITIYEKALGAIAKGGSTPLTSVYGYAEPVTTRGFAFMDSPGNDWTSVTGEVASGCNLVLFTTGRGSVFGFKPAPSIKIATNTSLFEHMSEDMDFNAGRLLDGESMQELAQELLELTIAVASGQPSKSEALGIGEAEFAPWHLGETL